MRNLINGTLERNTMMRMKIIEKMVKIYILILANIFLIFIFYKKRSGECLIYKGPLYFFVPRILKIKFLNFWIGFDHYLASIFWGYYSSFFLTIEDKNYIKFGLIKLSGEVFELEYLRNNTIYFSEYIDVDLHDSGIDFVPRIEGKGVLRLGYNKIKEIPSGYKQTMDLFLEDNLIKEIPEDFIQNGLINISGNMLEVVPHSLIDGKNKIEHQFFACLNPIREIPEPFLLERGKKARFDITRLNKDNPIYKPYISLDSLEKEFS